MKNLFLALSLSLAMYAHSQTTASPGKTGDTVPAELITDDSTYWMISTVSTVTYVNTTPGPYYNTRQNGGGMIVKFRFKKNNRYEFMLYVQANTYGVMSEAWTSTEGTVEFTKDEKGQPVFYTKAEKGTYRVTRNGSTSSRTIPADELQGQHSGRYLWEKTKFADDPKHIYLLMVDLKAHPAADIRDPKTIDPGWVSKFHIPVNE